ncbi:MAG: hypothetical protein R3E86_10885 [Pseudomonadales bacterium]
MSNETFRLRPLHRQRRGRHRQVRVLNQTELSALLGVTPEVLKERLDQLGWRYHEDSTGQLWATPQGNLSGVPPDEGPRGHPDGHRG